MSKETKKTHPEQVAEILSDAILRSGNAQGIVLAMAMEDGHIYTRGAGYLVTTLGLSRAVRLDAEENYQTNMAAEEED